MDIYENEKGDLVFNFGRGQNFADFLGLQNYRRIKSLYKYSSISDNLINSLKEGYLWFSRPFDFNDPYDCSININYASESSEYEKWVMFPENIKNLDINKVELYGDLKKLNRYNIDLKKIAKERDKRSILKLMNHIKYVDMFEIIGKSSGVCCFTIKPINILMWSHYGRNHSGLCLKFNSTYRSSFYNSAFPIQYSKKVPIFSYRNGDLGNEMKLFLKSIYTKSDIWSYEEEWRIINPSQNGKIYFEKGDLEEIIFGVNTSNDDIKNIIDIITSSGYNNVKFKRIKLEMNKYQLMICDFYE